MSEAPSEDFLLLTATLISSLPSSSSSRVDNALFLQLSALFGPMLTSALQLVDKGEVVRIRLPLGREIFQVASSSGMPYTLQPHLPPLLPALDPDEDKADGSEPSTTDPPEDTTSPLLPLDPPAKQDKQEDRDLRWARSNLARTHTLAKTMERMYCPCAGFMYNALAGERNYLCKHLLAVLIAHQTEREVRTEVGLAGMIRLLALNG